MSDSRLERMIARLTTQRACLDFAAAAITDVPGPVLEIGLGKGRTYTHLRGILPDREIFAFDRHVHAPPGAQPDADHTILGDFRATISDAVARFERRAALIHADIGSEKPARDRELAAILSPALARMTTPGGIVLCDRPLDLPGFEARPLPPDTGDFDYYLYRAPAAGGAESV